MDTAERHIAIPSSIEWQKVEITDIAVTNGSITAAFTSAGPGGAWMYVDEVQLVAQ